MVENERRTKLLPVRFTYLEAHGEKVYVSILGQFKHHFTGETVYKIRKEGERGWVSESWIEEKYIPGMLNRRVEE